MPSSAFFSPGSFQPLDVLAADGSMIASQEPCGHAQCGLVLEGLSADPSVQPPVANPVPGEGEGCPHGQSTRREGRGRGRSDDLAVSGSGDATSASGAQRLPDLTVSGSDLAASRSG